MIRVTSKSNFIVENFFISHIEIKSCYQDDLNQFEKTNHEKFENKFENMKTINFECFNIFDNLQFFVQKCHFKS